MTTHEVLTSLFWLVLLGYGAYLGWFAYSSIHRSRSHALTEARSRHPSTAKASVPEILEVDQRLSPFSVDDTSSGDPQRGLGDGGGATQRRSA